MDVRNCKKLESLESETHLESLSDLDTSGCDSLKKFCLSSKEFRAISLFWNPVQILQLPIGRFTELRELEVDGERLRSLPIDELCCLTNLEVFTVIGFDQVIDTMELHSLFDAWRNLRELCLEGWSYLSGIPDSIKGLTSLESLSLTDSAVETLPACVNHLSRLTFIFLRRCKRLKSILGLPPYLQKLDARDCTLLETVSSDSLLCKQCSFSFYNCVKLDEPSLSFIEELTSVRDKDGYYYDNIFRDVDRSPVACYPGGRVPKWMKYKQMTKASNVVEFTCNLERSPVTLLCCVVPHHPLKSSFAVSYDMSYDDNNKFHSEYYRSNVHWELALVDHELNSDHVFLWQTRKDIYGAGTGNDAKISCKFYVEYWNKEEKVSCEVPVEACGVHLIYCSESESGRKRKRVADICVEDGLPPTKQLKNSSVSRPFPLELGLELVTTKFKNLMT